MAATAAGTALTEAHRLAQVRLSGDVVKDTLAVWRLLDPGALDASFPAYNRSLQIVLRARREQSVRLSSAYLRAFREAEGVSGAMTVVRAAALSAEQASTSLLVTGPVEIKRALRQGLTLTQALERGIVATSGATTRLVQNGGRETVEGTVLGDERALGIARVTDGRPCSFCAMLASRGAVYKSEMTASFRSHDHCGCHSEPVYTRDAATPGRSDEFLDLWNQSTAGLSGAEARNAFRRAYESSAA